MSQTKPVVIKHYQDDETRWTAVQLREPEADGQFYFAVVTTGVYCRPICISRAPRRENVRFFESCDLAEGAGYRPCKRCKPRLARHGDPQATIIANACRLIEEAELVPSLAELAQASGMSQAHFHRLFKRVTGVTPKGYGQALRARRVKASLRHEQSVTGAIYEAGYQAASRFYEDAKAMLGMTPAQFKQGGPGLSIRYALSACRYGLVLIAATAKGVCWIQFGEEAELMEHALSQHFPHAEILEEDAQFKALVRKVLAAVELGQTPHGDLPLDIQGTAFQHRVWTALCEIPVGETVSYAQLAARIGNPKATRAVARACAANRLAVVIPCHRVVRSDGSPGGYRWGLARKRRILAAEQTRFSNDS